MAPPPAHGAAETLKYLAAQAEGVGDELATIIFWRALEELGHRRPDHVPAYKQPEPAAAPEQTGEQQPAKEPAKEQEPAKAPAKAPEASKEAPPPPKDEPEQAISPALKKLLDLATGDTRKAVRALIEDTELPDAVRMAKIKALINKQPK